MCKRLGWKTNDPIAVIFATDLTDGVFSSSTWTVFRDRLTWLRETLYEIKKITNVNWLVKPHPNDEIYGVVTSTISEYENICLNLDHIKIFHSLEQCIERHISLSYYWGETFRLGTYCHERPMVREMMVVVGNISLI